MIDIYARLRERYQFYHHATHSCSWKNNAQLANDYVFKGRRDYAGSRYWIINMRPAS